MTFKNYFELYAKFKPNCKMKKFPPLMTRQTTLIKHLQSNKSEILRSVNFVFKNSDEKYFLSVFSSENANMICVNTAMINLIPKGFDSKNDYEKFVNLYAIFAVLLNRSFQIDSFDDSILHEKIRDYLWDLAIYQKNDDDFILNLQNIVLNYDDRILRLIYRYGDDFLKTIFNAFIDNKLSENELIAVFDDDKEVGQDELQNLYELYKKQKICE